MSISFEAVAELPTKNVAGRKPKPYVPGEWHDACEYSRIQGSPVAAEIPTARNEDGTPDRAETEKSVRNSINHYLRYHNMNGPVSENPDGVPAGVKLRFEHGTKGKNPVTRVTLLINQRRRYEARKGE